MKKIYLFSTLVAGLLVFNSCNNEPDFDGLDEKSQITNVVKYITSYAGAVFSEDKPAREVLPDWLYGRYYTADKGSTAMVDYKFSVSIPDYVQEISNAAPYTLTSEDYQEVWGAGSLLNYFSPSKPARNLLPTVLAGAIAEPEEGDILVVNYNEAQEDGVGPVFSDDFETKTLDKWETVATQNTKLWAANSYNNNFYAETTAYNVNGGPVENYLITKTPVAISTGLNLSFDVTYRYVDGDAKVSLLISDNLAGFTAADINAATWDDLTSSFTVEDTNGNLTAIDPSISLDNYNGKSVYIAFKYTGNKDAGATTTVRIDNVTVQSADQVPVEYTAQTALYKYDGSAWATITDVEIVQPADYTAMGVDDFTATTAQAYMPSYLAYKYPLAAVGTVKAIAFKLSETAFMAIEYQKETTGWTVTGGITELTDEYEYDGSKWVFVRTVPKAALNEGFEERDYVEKEKTIIADWLNVMVKGEDFWRDRRYSGNVYTEAVAYGSKTEGEMEVWLITPQLEIKDNYVLTFDMVSGHWTHDALQVYISSSFSGKEEDLAQSIQEKKWTEITEDFDFPVKIGGYSPFTNVGSSSLDAYVGQQVYIAFKYWGDKSQGKTSTVQLDNIYVGE